MNFLDSSLIKVFKVIFLVDILVLIILAIVSDFVVIINSQFAFFSSLFISIASFYTFNNQVKQRASEYEDNTNQDELDKIDDKHDLYSDNDIQQQDVSQILKEEKEKLKTNMIKNTISSLPSYLSLYRVLGYLLLVVGFFYLQQHNIFDAIAYLGGFLIVPISATISTLIIRKDIKEN